jgi:membrane fusion protein (multidrug efflux system)
MRRVLPVAVIAAALLLAFFAVRLFWPHKDAAGAHGPGGPGGGMPPSPVETVTVHWQALPNAFDTVGSLRASQSVSLRPEVAGQVESIGFTEGQPVARGQVLFRLDDALVRADLNEAGANLENSRRAYARARELAGKQLIARADLDKAQATLGVDEARAGSARTRLDKTVIRAPFSGVAGLRKVNVGDYVDAGQDLVDLVRLDPLEIDLRAPEVVLGSLAVGQRVEFGVDAFRGETFPAVVVAIAPTVDAGGRSVSLRARLDNPDARLRPGMSARVRIVLATNARALVVPEQAIVPMGEGKNVYVVVDGKAKLVPVTVGVREPGVVEIASGLKDGDQVIVSGLQKVGDGAPVAATPAKPDAPDAADAPAAPAATDAAR